jgi:hypothetical protein
MDAQSRALTAGAAKEPWRRERAVIMTKVKDFIVDVRMGGKKSEQVERDRLVLISHCTVMGWFYTAWDWYRFTS